MLTVRGLVVLVALSVAGCTFKAKQEPPNTAHIPIPEKIKGLDPIHADDLYSGIQVAHAYETLLQYHHLKRPYTLIPGLAESMPELGADHKSYTVHLRKGILFHDDPCFKETGGKGREMIADDVVYSILRLADPRNNASGWWPYDGKIVGLNEWRAAQSKTQNSDYKAPIEGMKILDRYTLQFKLTRHSAQFLFALAMPFASIVPHEAVDYYGKDFLNHAVGTGPFRLESFNGASKIIWNKNPTYHLETFPTDGAEPQDRERNVLVNAGKPLPLLDREVDQVFEETQPMWLNFMAGKMDVAAIPKDSYAQAVTPSKELSAEMKAKGIILHKYPMLDITHITFNLVDPLMKNKLLRQALSLAYDQTQFNEIFYNGHALEAQGPIPPGVAGYDPNFKNPYRKFNVAKAKEYLAKAGYPDGKGLPVLEYASLADSTYRQAAEYLDKMFGAVGVKIRVQTYSWPEFLKIVKDHRAQIWSYAWSGDYPDAENFLQLFYSKNVSPGPNDSNYTNPEFDRLYEKALEYDDSAERTALYKKMVGILVEDCPWIWEANRIGFAVSHNWLSGYKHSDVELNSSKYLGIDPGLKAK